MKQDNKGLKTITEVDVNNSKLDKELKENSLIYAIVKTGQNLDKNKLLTQFPRNMPLLLYKWIEDCYDVSAFISIVPYSLNMETTIVFNTDALIKETDFLETLEADNKEGLYLSNCVIYCQQLENLHERKLQKGLTLLAGGTFLEIYAKVVTHVIVTSISIKNKYKENIYDTTSLPHIVGSQWLRDCIINKKRMPEEKYIPMVFNPTAETILLTNRSLIDSVSFENTETSILFRGRIFKIVRESYSEEEVKQIVIKIINHAGLISQGNIFDYLITNDGSCGNVLSSLGEVENEKYLLVSHRWIDHCIKYRSIIDIKRNKMIYLLPFPFVTPYNGIDKYHIGFLGIRAEDRFVFTNIYNGMGGIVEKEVMDANFIVLDSIIINNINNGKKLSEKIRKILRDKSETPVVYPVWILDYLEYGTPPEDRYFEVPPDIIS